MKMTFKMLCITFMLLMPMAAHADHHEEKRSNLIYKAMKGESAIMASGIVNRVNRMNHKINLTHDPVPQLNWPEMTMDFDVAKDVNLKGLSSGQKVKFHIMLGEDKVYHITKIMVVED